ncbi:MAG: pyruvate dehydrogenase complex dihydrolipoamide acetyltransferase [Saprospiraceae bacterium]|nr:pyruvate dehydrogenase complex dihydrolipoamide acetyltransferase [Saprospiraceae bacterium]MCB9321314.1 pyruvate dehydrogenase complex dihydrolipoamide acetyltransferase [Lewinellaceae bacterium]
MAEVIRMPRMSDTMEEGVIVSWLKKEGDQVKTGDLLAEIETDKATMDFESLWEGTLLHIGAKEGEAIPIDGIIAVIGKKGEDFKAALANAGNGVPEASAPADSTASSKSSESPAPASATAAKPSATAPATDADTDRLKASPLAKAMAKESGIDIASIKGTGDQGRIVRRDVEAAIETGGTAPAAAVTPVFGQESFEEINVSQMRKTIARRLAESKFSAPHFYLTLEINMGRASDARQRILDMSGEKVSFNDMVVKACAMALRKHPAVNSSWMGDKIRRNHHVHVGVAVAVSEGLLVPVIRHTDLKSMTQINTEVKALAAKAKDKKLQPEEMQGNTFTISNLGMFGIEEFTAIINPPDACILAIGAIIDKPIIQNGAVVAGKMMKVTLSCDHRVVDGATGAQFLQTVKQYLEEPMMMLV